MSQTRSKYNVDTSPAGKQARTYNGRTYDSTAEANFAETLDVLKRAGQVRAWEPQVSVDLHGVNGSLMKRYRCDFVVTYADDRVEWLEIKGVETPVWKLTEKLFRDEYPDRTLRVVMP